MGATMKTRKYFILEQQKINKVKKILQAKTDTDAVARALDIIIECSKISAALQSSRGRGRIKDVYGRTSS